MKRQHSRESLIGCMGRASNATQREVDMQAATSNSLMFDYSELREEARKGWNYFVTDSLVYFSEMLNGNSDPFLLVPEKDLWRRHWLELHIRLVGKPENQLRMVIEFIDSERHCTCGVKPPFTNDSVKRDMTMFVNIPESIQNPEVLPPVRIPTVVWLKGPDCDNGLFGNAVRRLGKSVLCVESVLTIDRKTDSLRRVGRIGSGQLPCQMVESRPEATDEVPGNQSDLDVLYFGRANLNDILSSFKIILGNKAISMIFSPNFYGLAEGVEMHLRPIDFMHYSLDWGHGFSECNA